MDDATLLNHNNLQNGDVERKKQPLKGICLYWFVYIEALQPFVYPSEMCLDGNEDRRNNFYWADFRLERLSVPSQHQQWCPHTPALNASVSLRETDPLECIKTILDTSKDYL